MAANNKFQMSVTLKKDWAAAEYSGNLDARMSHDIKKFEFLIQNKNN